MSLLTAFSLDLNKNINSTDADYAFKEGKIISQKNFRCPTETCRIAVICANLEKPKEARKVAPYFKSTEDHVLSCPFKIEEAMVNQSSKERTAESYYEGIDTTKGNTLINLAIPSLKSQNSAPISSSKDIAKTTSTSSAKKNSEHLTNRTKTISTLVSSFLKRENFKITLPYPFGEEVTLRNLFIKINGQNLDTLPQDTLRMYHGKVWINKVKNGFQVKFLDKLEANTINGKTKKSNPTLFIPEAEIINSPYKKFREIESMLKGKPKDFFLLSDTPALNSSEKYINFKFQGLQYLEVRS